MSNSQWFKIDVLHNINARIALKITYVVYKEQGVKIRKKRFYVSKKLKSETKMQKSNALVISGPGVQYILPQIIIIKP